MLSRKATSWSFWTERILSLGESLAKVKGDNSLPIPLKKIAATRKVSTVLFRPLLVDGCLTVTDNGFKIYVRCGKEEAAEAAARYEAERELGPLPPRMRFTIAHEIAHTFFFEVPSEGRPRNRLSIGHQNTLRALERACNLAAGRILLPTDLLQGELRTSDAFSPYFLRWLAGRAAVSGPMLVNRLRDAGLDDIGVLAYAEIEGNRYTLRAVAVHGALREIFPGARIGGELSRVVSDRRFLLNGGTQCETEISVQCRTQYSRVVQRFHVSCERPESRGNHRGVFVAVRRLD